jgi:hypothetical protein
VRRLAISLVLLVAVGLASLVAQTAVPDTAIPADDYGPFQFGGWIAGGGTASQGRIYTAVPYFPDHNTILGDPILQFEGGATTSIRLAPSLLVDAGIGVSSRARSYRFDSGVQGDPSDDTWIRESIVYLVLPTVVRLDVPVFGALRASVGAGLGINASIVRTGRALSSNDTTTRLPSSWFAADFPRLFSISGILRVGVSYRFGRFALGAHADYEHHLTPDFNYDRLESAHFQVLNAGASLLISPRPRPLE